MAIILVASIGRRNLQYSSHLVKGVVVTLIAATCALPFGNVADKPTMHCSDMMLCLATPYQGSG